MLRDDARAVKAAERPVAILRRLGDSRILCAEEQMIPDKVRAVLDRYGLKPREFEPGSTPTSPLAARKLGVGVGQIAKSLVFLGKDGKLAMVVCAGDRKVSNSKLKALLGVKSRMANGDETLAATGFLPGGVCPFGVEGIRIYIDASLAEYDTVFPACGDDASGVPTNHGQLLEITGGKPCDVCEDREPRG
jgi:prolyl-tRNA editing enzyme YbaK/EbsC (Cys-tRNA(Pro) deacylase)